MEHKIAHFAIAFEGEVEPEDAQAAAAALGGSVARLARLSALEGPRDPLEALVVCQWPGQSFMRGAPIAIQKARDLGYSKVALKFQGRFPMIDVSGSQSVQELANAMFSESQRLGEKAALERSQTPEAIEARQSQADRLSSLRDQEAGALAQTRARLSSSGFESDPSFYKSLGNLVISLDRLGGHESPSMGVAIAALRSAGFKDNEGAGSSQVSDGEHPEQRGRYLVGQLLAMSSKGAIEPKLGDMLINLADRWSSVDAWPSRELDASSVLARRAAQTSPVMSQAPAAPSAP